MVDLFGPLGLDLDGACPSCGSPLDDDQRGGYCAECDSGASHATTTGD